MALAWQIYPRKRSSSQRWQGDQWLWLGVNGDEDVGRLEKAELDKKVNFRSWHDGRNGSIADRFAVRGWPAMYVVDQNGIICYKSSICVDLEQAKPAIESLVAKAERVNDGGEAK